MNTTTGNQSEVARLRIQIEQEYEAAQMWESTALATTKYEFITARVEHIGLHQAAFTQFLREEASVMIMCGIYGGDSSRPGE